MVGAGAKLPTVSRMPLEYPNNMSQRFVVVGGGTGGNYRTPVVNKVSNFTQIVFWGSGDQDRY